MANLTKGKTFTNGELVTPQKLHELVDLGGVAGIVNSDIADGAAIADSKLATISTAGKVANSATTATNTNTASAIVARDASGNFSAGTITAALSGNATTATTAAACSGNAATATKLATARTINGVAFDGSSNITIATGVSGTIPVSQGGTGATTASGALANLGAQAAGSYAAATHTHDASNITTGTLSNARTTATTAAAANTIVQRGASGEITIGNATSQPNSFNYGEFWSTNGTDYSILGRGNVQIANGGAIGTILVSFFGGGNTLGYISRSGTNSVAYATSSDYRLKTNLEPLTGALERVLQIPVHRFNWTDDPTGPKVDGFLAHEAQAVVRECVVGTKDEVDAEGKPKYQGIDQSKLVPLLLAAVQELAARVAALESAK